MGLELSLSIYSATALAESAGENPVYRLAVLTFKCLNWISPTYFADELLGLRTWRLEIVFAAVLSSSVIVHRSRLSTVGDRAFPIAVRVRTSQGGTTRL